VDELKVKKQVSDMSGHCRFPTRDGSSHRTCTRMWETPSVWVVCDCPCHVERVGGKRMVAKGKRRKIVAKK